MFFVNTAIRLLDHKMQLIVDIACIILSVVCLEWKEIILCGV